jgi:hypothetical protein
MELHLGD